MSDRAGLVVDGYGSGTQRQWLRQWLQQGLSRALVQQRLPRRVPQQGLHDFVASAGEAEAGAVTAESTVVEQARPAD